MRAAVSGREVAVDAVVDLHVLGLDVERFGDLERRILLDLHVAPIMEDPLVGVSGRRRQEQEQGGEGPPEFTHGQAAGWANDTWGADWIAGSSSW